MRQTLPFPNKILPDIELDRLGSTDNLFRFSDRKKLGGFVVREQHVPGGDSYKTDMSRDKVVLRERELDRFAKAGFKHGISVVSHQDIVAKLDQKSDSALWQVAKRVDGLRLNELFRSNPEEALVHYEKVIKATMDYLEYAVDSESTVVISDILKPSQFIVGDDGDLTFVDTNPPLWERETGVDWVASGLVIDSFGHYRLSGENDLLIDTILRIEDLGEKVATPTATRSIRNITNAPPSARKVFTDIAIANIFEEQL